MSAKKRSGRRDGKDPWGKCRGLDTHPATVPSACFFLKGVAGVQPELLTMVRGRKGQMTTGNTAEAQPTLSWPAGPSSKLQGGDTKVKGSLLTLEDHLLGSGNVSSVIWRNSKNTRGIMYKTGASFHY